MKYILIEHAAGNDPKHLCIFDSKKARAKATRDAILGPNNKGVPCPELKTLAEDGIVTFEGDPPVEWVDAVVSFGG